MFSIFQLSRTVFAFSGFNTAGTSITSSVLFLLLCYFNSLASGCSRGFSEKKHLNARGFAWEYLCSCSGYGPGWSVKRRKFFDWEMQVFGEWRHKWRTFRPPWPTLPGPGRQPLGGSISLKFSLETKLQSESFDTLDDLLGFQVQSYDLS